MNLVRHPGCSLELFSTDVAELNYNKKGEGTGARLARLRREGHTEAIRQVIVNFGLTGDRLPTQSLDDFLTVIDSGMKQIVSSIGANVIEHTWGLVKRTSAITPDYHPPHLHQFGLDDYLLAARVPLLSGTTITPGTPHYAAIEQPLFNARNDFLAEHGWTFREIHLPVQYTSIGHSATATQIVLHDIDIHIH